MEPGESKSVAANTGDSIPDSKSGGKVGDVGSTPVASVATVAATATAPDNPPKLQEGGGRNEGVVQQVKKPVKDEASGVTVATNSETIGKESGRDSINGATTATASASKPLLVVGATAGPPNKEPKGGKGGKSTATGARTPGGVTGGSGVRENTKTATGGPGDAPPTENATNLEAKPRETTAVEANKTPAANAPPKTVTASGSGTTLPTSLPAKEAPPERTTDPTAVVAGNISRPTGGVLTERKGAENGIAEGVGGATTTGEGGVSPTPPRTRSNPITRGTPPHRGSRGGNLVICTQQPYSPGGEGGQDWPKPTSPRSRPRDQPLVRAKNDARRGGGGSGADGSGDEDAAGETKEKAASFSSMRWKASDEYVLDEDR